MRSAVCVEELLYNARHVSCFHCSPGKKLKTRGMGGSTLDGEKQEKKDKYILIHPCSHIVSRREEICAHL